MREREREMIATVTMSCATDESKTIRQKSPVEQSYHHNRGELMTKISLLVSFFRKKNEIMDYF